MYKILKEGIKNYWTFFINVFCLVGISYMWLKHHYPSFYLIDLYLFLIWLTFNTLNAFGLIEIKYNFKIKFFTKKTT